MAEGDGIEPLTGVSRHHGFQDRSGSQSRHLPLAVPPPRPRGVCPMSRMCTLFACFPSCQREKNVERTVGLEPELSTWSPLRKPSTTSSLSPEAIPTTREALYHLSYVRMVQPPGGASGCLRYRRFTCRRRLRNWLRRMLQPLPTGPVMLRCHPSAWNRH